MKTISSILVATLLLGSSTAFAALIIYPGQGQSPAQQQDDEGECYIWARNQTGIDPMAQQATAPVAPPQEQGRAVGGAMKGAIIGGIIDGSDGAKTGAAVGAVGGRMRQNSRNRAAQQQNQQQQQQVQSINAENQATFEKAYGVCLTGRGYTVS